MSDQWDSAYAGIVAVVLAALAVALGYYIGSDTAQARVLRECKADGGFRLYVREKQYFYYCGYLPQR
jgi:hypothetical protein